MAVDIQALSGGQLVSWFLMSSYLYYHCNTSAIPDQCFDQLCDRLLKEWPKIKHPHKNLISKADLAAGSGYAIPLRKYPLITCSAAWQWLDEMQGQQKGKV